MRSSGKAQPVLTEPSAQLLESLVETYCDTLPENKRGLVPADLADRLAGMHGLVALQQAKPIAGVLWNDPYGTKTATCQFFAATPHAPESALNHFLSQFTANRHDHGYRILFELWLPRESPVPAILRGLAYREVPRRMLCLRRFGHRRHSPRIQVNPLVEYARDHRNRELLAELLFESYRTTLDQSIYPHLECADRSLAYLDRLLAAKLRPVLDRGSYVVISGASATPIGLTLCYPFTSSEFAYLEQLVVHPRKQRQGVARALLGACLNSLYAAGFRGLFLTVTDANFAALSLYDSLRFEYFSPEAVFMSHQSRSGLAQ